MTCSSCRRRRERMPPPPPRVAASAARRTLRFAPQPCGARECAKLRESCVTARRSHCRSGAMPRAARREPRAATLSAAVTGSVRPPSPLWVPTESGAPFDCGSLLIAEPRCCRRRYCRRRRYCTELYCKARLGTPTSSPRRNFAALAAPGEGGAEGGGNGAPLSPPNSSAAPPPPSPRHRRAETQSSESMCE